MDAATYSLNGWAADLNWTIDPGKDYPRLAWEHAPGGPIPAPVFDWFKGSGTQEDPYLIETVDQLERIGNYTIIPNKCFRLDADLDLSGRVYQSSLIGAFNGRLQGSGHRISNLFLKDVKSGGLFGVLNSSAVIENLALDGVKITGAKFAKYMGMLAGDNSGTVIGCDCEGRITGDRELGGLIGCNQPGALILNCRATGSIIAATLNVGGLIGVDDGAVVDSYAATAVSGQGHVGGLVGDDGGGYGIIIHSYFLDLSDGGGPDNNLGEPLSDIQMQQADSLEGWHFQDKSDHPLLGGWFLPDGGYPVLSWQTSITGLALIPDIYGLSLDEARAALERAGFLMGEAHYDYHSEVPTPCAVGARPWRVAPVGGRVDVDASLGPYDWAANQGDGTEAKPYRIETPGQLEAVGDHPELWGRCFILADDLHVESRSYIDALVAMDANGLSSGFQGPTFSGCFDGDGHTIYDLLIVDRSRGSSLGLFGRLGVTGRVRNLSLCDAVIQFKPYSADVSGLLVGLNSGTITNCHVTGCLLAMAGPNRGGLAGWNSGAIEDCSADVLVHGTESIGGLVGYNEGIAIRCESSGLIHASGNHSGGLVGTNNGIVAECYADATVSGDEHVGALVGVNFQKGSIDASHAAGTTAGNHGAGGLAGHNYGRVTRSWAPSFDR